MSNQRRRAITQQMHGEPVQFADVRIVELGGRAGRTVVGEVDGLDGHLRGRRADRPRHARISWWFGMPVWEGTIDGRPVAVQVRPILNGYQLTYEGVEVAARVLTERETELAALMPEKRRPTRRSSCSARCRASSCRLR